MAGRTIAGLMTTSAVDRVGDTVKPDGVQYKCPFPLLLGHDHSKPIGSVTSVQRLNNGLMAHATLVPPGVSADADYAWGMLQAKALNGLSIGFRPLDMDVTESGVQFVRCEVFELSLVAVPCNQDAEIVAFNATAKAAPVDEVNTAVAVRKNRPSINLTLRRY